jgi:hypothetical protein
MTFAFGRRAYYLYWKRPDGRIGWGANLPSEQYLSLKEARAVAAEDWLHTLRSAYANDIPGARLAAETTSDTLQAVGGPAHHAAGSALAPFTISGTITRIKRCAIGPGALAWLIRAPRAAIFSTLGRRSRS